MRPYPQLSEDAYANEATHTEEVVEMMADVAADVWRYYKGFTLNETQQAQLQEVIKEFAKKLTPPVQQPSSKQVTGKVIVINVPKINSLSHVVKRPRIKHQEGLSYTIYVNPRDFPGEVVIRGWCGADSAGIKARCKTLEEARDLIPEGLQRIEHDDPVMVESWLSE